MQGCIHHFDLALGSHTNFDACPAALAITRLLRETSEEIPDQIFPTPLGIFAHYRDKLVRFRTPPEVIQHMNRWDRYEECVPRTFEFDPAPWEVVHN
jgi:hypothetical protein